MPLDRSKSIDDYRALATRYDRATRRIDAVRRRAVDALDLKPGETVIDVACGTGYCFAPIMARIGATGTLIAFDQSPELLAVARARTHGEGWQNVVVIEAEAEQVDFSSALVARAASAPTAVLFSYAHDVMQSRAALTNIFGQVQSGARVAATGTRLWPRWWLWPLSIGVNSYLWHTHACYMTARESNFDRPWRLLATFLHDVHVRAYWPGWRYVACGRLRADIASAAVPAGRSVRS